MTYKNYYGYNGENYNKRSELQYLGTSYGVAAFGSNRAVEATFDKNLLRDNIFGGNEKTFNTTEDIFNMAGTAMVVGASALPQTSSKANINNEKTGSKTSNTNNKKSADVTAEEVHIKQVQLPEGSQWERNVLNSFKGGNAVEKTYGEGTTLYRVGGKNGGFWSLEQPPATEYRWRVDFAIKQEFGNDASMLYKMTIPKGASIS